MSVVTISAIKADIGGYVGYSAVDPELPSKAERRVGEAVAAGRRAAVAPMVVVLRGCERFVSALGAGAYARLALKRFPNGELHVEAPARIADGACVIVGSISPPPGNLERLTLVAHALRWAGAGRLRIRWDGSQFVAESAVWFPGMQVNGTRARTAPLRRRASGSPGSASSFTRAESTRWSAWTCTASRRLTCSGSHSPRSHRPACWPGRCPGLGSTRSHSSRPTRGPSSDARRSRARRG